MKIDLANTFSYHAPTTVHQKLAYDLNRKTLLDAAITLTKNTPESAEQTIAIRKMQEAMFYFNAAVALNPDFFNPGSGDGSPMSG